MVNATIRLKKRAVGLADLVLEFGTSVLSGQRNAALLRKQLEVLGFEENEALGRKTVAFDIGLVDDRNVERQQHQPDQSETLQWQPRLQMPEMLVALPIEQRTPNGDTEPTPFSGGPSKFDLTPTEEINHQFELNPTAPLPKRISLFSANDVRTLVEAAAKNTNAINWPLVVERIAQQTSLTPLPLKDENKAASHIVLVFDFSEGQKNVYWPDAEDLYQSIAKTRSYHGLEAWELADGPSGSIELITQRGAEEWASNTVVFFISSFWPQQSLAWQARIAAAQNNGARVLLTTWNKTSVDYSNQRPLNAEPVWHQTQSRPPTNADIQRLLQAISVLVTIEARIVRALRANFLPNASAELERQVLLHSDIYGELGTWVWHANKAQAHREALKDRTLWPEEKLLELQKIVAAEHRYFSIQQCDEELLHIVDALGSFLEQHDEIQAKSNTAKTNRMALSSALVNYTRNTNTAVALGVSDYAQERLARAPEDWKLSEEGRATFEAYYRPRLASAESINTNDVEVARRLKGIEKDNPQTPITLELVQLGRQLWLWPQPTELDGSKRGGQVLSTLRLEGTWLHILCRASENTSINDSTGKAYLASVLGKPIQIGYWQKQLPFEIRISWATGVLTVKTVTRPRGLFGWEKTPNVAIPNFSLPFPRKNVGIDDFGAFLDVQIGTQSQRFRWIEPGTFVMGASEAEIAAIVEEDYRKWASEREFPQHEVAITQGFWLADTPCTIEMYESLNNSSKRQKPQKRSIPTNKEISRPASGVSWDDANAFLREINRYLPEGLQTDLPTEAEWEYACRAGTHTAYFWGNEVNNASMNVGRLHNRSTTRVKNFLPNPWGLYDMHGNVWELCADEGLRTYTRAAQLNPRQVGEKEAMRVIRGGAWGLPPASARAAFRGDTHRGDVWSITGLRLALRSIEQPGREGLSGGAHIEAVPKTSEAR
jgi:formylglycine-generating enzyme